MTGRAWAYTGALLGASASVAANVAHSYVPPAGAAAGWAPHVGAVVGAVFWPVALMVALEILARTAWPGGWGWGALRWLGLGLVAAVAAVVSYLHMSGLLAYYGEHWLTVRFGPLAVDGLMVMAAGALIATGRAVSPSPKPTPKAAPATPDHTGVHTPATPPAELSPALAAVAAVDAAQPGLSRAKLAAAAQVSESTVAQYRRAIAQTNGRVPALTGKEN